MRQSDFMSVRSIKHAVTVKNMMTSMDLINSKIILSRKVVYGHEALSCLLCIPQTAHRSELIRALQ